MADPSPAVLDAFGAAGATVRSLEGGHVHRTYAVRPDRGLPLVVQAVNAAVVGSAWALAERTVAVTEALASRPDEVLDDREALRTRDGAVAFRDEHGDVWRAFRLVDGVVAANVAPLRPSPADVANLFGRFSRRAEAAGVEPFATQPFHDLGRRVEQYRTATAQTDRSLPSSLTALLGQLVASVSAPSELLPPRIVHNDAKPANLLVHDNDGTPVAVIDLDLVDEGSIVDDLGDLVRSQAFTGAELNVNVVVDVTTGYLAGLAVQLSVEEGDIVPRAGEIITTELAIRRATDHLTGGAYFADADGQENLFQAELQARRAMELLARRDEIRSALPHVASRLGG